MIEALPSSAGAEAAAAPATGGLRDTPEARRLQLRNAAHAFEGLLWNMMLGSMRRTLAQAPYFGGGFAETVWTQLFDMEISLRAAQQGRGNGIAEILIRRLEPYAVWEEDRGTSFDA